MQVPCGQTSDSKRMNLVSIIKYSDFKMLATNINLLANILLADKLH